MYVGNDKKNTIQCIMSFYTNTFLINMKINRRLVLHLLLASID